MLEDNRNKFLVVLVGLPASGKSTARQRAIDTGAACDSYVYSTDDYIDQAAAEQGKTYSEIFESVIGAARHEADRGLRAAISAGQNVLWDQTNMSPKKRRGVLKRFPADYVKQCLCILPPFTDEQEAELVRRLESREGKNIPEHVMRSMRASFVPPSREEGFDSVMFFDMYGRPMSRTQARKHFG